MNNQLSKLLVTSALVASLMPSAYAAAGSEGHGGNAVVCNGQTPVVLDYYNATLPTIGSPAPALVDISGFSSDQVVSLFESRFSGLWGFNDLFKNALQTLGPISNWISADLKAAGDSNEAYNLPPGCQMEQAADRQGTTMFGDPSVINQLSPAQQGILVVHEALYYIGDTIMHLNTSENIRAVIREALKQNYSQSSLIQAIDKIAGEINPWAASEGKKYLCTTTQTQSVWLEITFSNANDSQIDLQILRDAWHPSGFQVSQTFSAQCGLYGLTCTGTRMAAISPGNNPSQETDALTISGDGKQIVLSASDTATSTQPPTSGSNLNCALEN